MCKENGHPHPSAVCAPSDRVLAGVSFFYADASHTVHMGGSADGMRTLTSLPDDALTLIVHQLTPVSVSMASRTCKTLFYALEDHCAANMVAVENKIALAANEVIGGQPNSAALLGANQIRLRGRAGWGVKAEPLVPHELCILVSMARRGRKHSEPFACDTFELMARPTSFDMWPCEPGSGVAFGTALGTVIANGVLANVRTLRLGCNGIGDGGAEAVARGLRVNGALPLLRVLELDNNEVGPRGAKALSDAFRTDHHRSLEVLLLFGNPAIGDGGFAALAAALRDGALPMLAHLNVRLCGFGTAGIVALAQAIACGAVHEGCERTKAGGTPFTSPRGHAQCWHVSLCARVSALSPFAQAPPPCTVCGREPTYRALSRCTYLNFAENNIEDRGLLALVSMMAEGALPHLVELWLRKPTVPARGCHKLDKVACSSRRRFQINGRATYEGGFLCSDVVSVL